LICNIAADAAAAACMVNEASKPNPVQLEAISLASSVAEHMVEEPPGAGKSLPEIPAMVNLPRVRSTGPSAYEVP
jgi:hypothetical protein